MFAVSKCIPKLCYSIVRAKRRCIGAATKFPRLRPSAHPKQPAAPSLHQAVLMHVFGDPGTRRLFTQPRESKST